MPNWANVTYHISGSKESINKLEVLLNELNSAEQPRVKNGFGNLWLGCIVDALGGEWEKVECRGDVYYYEADEGGMTMNMEMAWGELSGFRRFLEKNLDVNIIYYCEEPGMCEFYHNDLDGPEFYIDAYSVELCEYVHSDFVQDFEELQERIEKVTGQKPGSFEDAEKICKQYTEKCNDEGHEDTYIYVVRAKMVG